MSGRGTQDGRQARSKRALRRAVRFYQLAGNAALGAAALLGVAVQRDPTRVVRALNAIGVTREGVNELRTALDIVGRNAANNMPTAEQTLRIIAGVANMLSTAQRHGDIDLRPLYDKLIACLPQRMRPNRGRGLG